MYAYRPIIKINMSRLIIGLVDINLDDLNVTILRIKCSEWFPPDLQNTLGLLIIDLINWLDSEKWSAWV